MSVTDCFIRVPESSFPEVKRVGRESDNLPPSMAELKNLQNYTSSLPCVFTV
jgi:hypothetical protein